MAINLLRKKTDRCRIIKFSVFWEWVQDIISMVNNKQGHGIWNQPSFGPPASLFSLIYTVNFIFFPWEYICPCWVSFPIIICNVRDQKKSDPSKKKCKNKTQLEISYKDLFNTQIILKVKGEYIQHMYENMYIPT